MFSIVITEKGGAQRQLDFQGAEIGIGRLEDNELCLPKNNVSKYHARLVFKDERYVIVDQKSTNGTYVNGRRISAPMVVRKGDKIYIGDFILTLAAASGGDGIAARELRAATAPATEPRAGAPATRVHDMGRVISDRPPAIDGRAPESFESSAPALRGGAGDSSARQTPGAASSAPPPGAPSSGPPPLPKSDRLNQSALAAAAAPTEPSIDVPPQAAIRPSARSQAAAARAAAPWSGETAAAGGLTSPAVLAPSIRLQGALASLMERLRSYMNVERAEESAFPSELNTTLERLMDELAAEGAIGPDLDRRFLREAAISEAVGLGPLDRLLANRSVREVVIDGPNRILADLGGGLTSVSSFFSDDNAVLLAARRLLHRAGQELDEQDPLHEAQLPGGGHLQLLLPPLSPKGALLAVRCPPRALGSAEGMVTEGMLTSDMLAVLRAAVQQRRNVLVVGPIGAGVSSVLALLATLAPEHERLVTIEDAPGTNLLNPQALPLSRKALPDQPLGEFLRQAAFLRYDRLLIDDLRPEDILNALGAAAAGNGVLLGMHTPNPEIALHLLELFAQPGAGAGFKPLLAAAVHVLVQVGPDGSGARRIQSLCELRYRPPDALELRPLFRHDGKAFLEQRSS